MSPTREHSEVTGVCTSGDTGGACSVPLPSWCFCSGPLGPCPTLAIPTTQTQDLSMSIFYLKTQKHGIIVCHHCKFFRSHTLTFVYNKTIRVCVCELCKVQIIPSWATELIWCTRIRGLLSSSVSPHPSHGPLVAQCPHHLGDLPQWWLWTPLCSSKQVTLAAKCHCTPKLSKSLGQQGM